jgi:hypothetical protein
VDKVAPGAEISVEIKAPTATHVVTFAQLRRWVDDASVSPDETLKKRKLKAKVGVGICGSRATPRFELT